VSIVDQNSTVFTEQRDYDVFEINTGNESLFTDTNPGDFIANWRAKAEIMGTGNIGTTPGVGTTTLKIQFGIASMLTVTFASEANRADVLTKINGVITGAGVATFFSYGPETAIEHRLRIIATSATDTITIGAGTSNTLFGLTEGTVVAIPVQQPSVSGGVGEQFSVTWTTPKGDADFLPLYWESLSDSFAFNGEPDANDDGVVENSVSGGAQMFVENGAGSFWTLQVDPRGWVDPLNPTASELYTGVKDALPLLEQIDTYCIVPMVPVATTLADSLPLITALKNHVVTMSGILVRRERIAVVGVPAGTDVTSNPETNVYKPLASTFSLSRICVVAPSDAKITFNSTSCSVDGSYIAAMVAGIITNSNVDAGEPITGKVLSGFTEIKDKFTDLQKTKLGNAGVLMCLPTPEVATANIILDLTTNPTSILDSSIKIQRINDVVTKSLRTTLHRLYINTRNLGASTLASISSSTQTLLLQFVNQRVIVDFRDLKVTQNLQDPRQVDVEFKMRPTFEVNYIYVKFTTTAF
jgi:hypothetical protein